MTDNSIAWVEGALVAGDQRAQPHEPRQLRIATADELIAAIATSLIRGRPRLASRRLLEWRWPRRWLPQVTTPTSRSDVRPRASRRRGQPAPVYPQRTGRGREVNVVDLWVLAERTHRQHVPAVEEGPRH